MPEPRFDPARMALLGRIGAATLHARGGTTTEAARAAFRDRFLREADPDGTLSPEERERRAAHLRRAHYLRLALKSADARRSRRAAAVRASRAGKRAGPPPEPSEADPPAAA